jgi:hypothetical protein
MCHGYDNQKEFSAATFFQKNKAFGLLLARFCKNINLEREGSYAREQSGPRIGEGGTLSSNREHMGLEFYCSLAINQAAVE